MYFENRTTHSVGLFAVLLLLTATGTAASKTTTTQPKPKSLTATSHHSSKTHHASKASAKHKSKSHGQHAIDSERTRQIQAALIREHYLSGEPSGVWDQASRDAMLRFQGDNGWQTKLTPDSRALIKLGLGPDHKGLLNPETAVIASPHELGVDHVAHPGGAADQP